MYMYNEMMFGTEQRLS